LHTLALHTLALHTRPLHAALLHKAAALARAGRINTFPGLRRSILRVYLHTQRECCGAYHCCNCLDLHLSILVHTD
jgi:hypothetical protein